MAPHAALVLERGATDERSHGSGTGGAAWKRHGASGQEPSPRGAPCLGDGVLPRSDTACGAPAKAPVGSHG